MNILPKVTSLSSLNSISTMSRSVFIPLISLSLTNGVQIIIESKASARHSSKRN